jgi:hypothetical protein
MRELGAEDPEGWASSELAEDIAQEARWLVIRQVREAVTWTDDRLTAVPQVAALVDAGADRQLVLAAVREVAREAAFAAVEIVDAGEDPNAPEDSPRWTLLEIRSDPDGEDFFTGRDVGGLHEDLGFPTRLAATATDRLAGSKVGLRACAGWSTKQPTRSWLIRTIGPFTIPSQ